ncbi:sigma-70 family RNA polymerase sigma factor [Synechococcus sp. HK05]|uniref:sigma-70 family RNA polymerase sigma factor n=1 Tax=Synechococcus sp. HK05 TaxID=2725975 RepID=UPI001C381D4A|nr:sigma-70 family RNA polymerase sigma factor [Synechococcus sp. HK05]MBV2351095.1 sigma-70 family RNA polymerase sigma factor [Synechococcus sp. HK05]
MHTLTPRADFSQRNAALLAAYQQCRSTTNRNAVIHANLPLVWRVARQESQRSGHSFDDLTQEGCLGLIKAVERFDPGRGHSLSTAAVPWIRGAIRHYLRDRSHTISGSHHLLELHRRGQVLQEQRQQQGLAPLSAGALATALGCSLERWQLALARRRSLQLASLEQPHFDDDGELTPLVEQLPDSRGNDHYAPVLRQEQRRQLWRVLCRLERRQRRWILGRLLQRHTWGQLANGSGLSAKAMQRRYNLLLQELRQQLTPLMSS